MATIRERKTKSGSYFQIQFYLDKTLKALSLSGNYSKRQANEIKIYVENIVDSIYTGREPDRRTQAFLDTMGDDLRERFERSGLIEESKKITLCELWDRFIDETGGRKESTILTYVAARKRFFPFFDECGDPNAITEEDGLEWKAELQRHYAEATVAGSFQRTTAVFLWGVKNGFMKSNPFSEIPRGSFVNPDRMFYVQMKDYEKLLDACPDQTWRTILALNRIGGLRNPSETLAVRWEDVNWANRSIFIRSVKTERYAGKGSRVIPMFPDLRIELEKQFDQAEEGGSPYVIDRWRDTEMNMRTHFERIIFRAGLQQWPRLFQNLRESRANEIWSDYPEHVAASWMGHSRNVAFKHYLQVTDDQFQKAVSDKPETNDSSRSCVKMGNS